MKTKGAGQYKYIISIDDGFVEYAYEFPMCGTMSINKVVRKLEKIYGSPLSIRLRRSHHNENN